MNQDCTSKDILASELRTLCWSPRRPASLSGDGTPMFDLILHWRASHGFTIKLLNFKDATWSSLDWTCFIYFLFCFACFYAFSG